MERDSIFLLSVPFVLTGLFIIAINFVLDPFGGSFYCSLFIGGSFIWLVVVLLDGRTRLRILWWQKMHPRVDFVGSTAVITASRLATFTKASGVFGFIVSLGLIPWFYPGFFLPSDFVSDDPDGWLWSFSFLVVMFPCAVYVFFLGTARQKIFVNRDFIKREVHGLGWRSELISHSPELDIDAHLGGYVIEFVIANVDYSRQWAFGSKQEHFKVKRIVIPETRNVPVDEVLRWLFPEQQHLIQLVYDIVALPKNSRFPSKKEQRMRQELIRQQELHRAHRNNGNKPT